MQQSLVDAYNSTPDSVIIAVLAVLAIIVWVLLMRLVLIIYIKSNSIRLKRLKEINTRYAFHEVDQRYEYITRVDTKQKYDRLDPEKLFLEEVKGNTEHFQFIYDCTVENREIFEEYEAEFAPLLEYESIKNPIIIWFNKLEKKELEKTLLRPVLAPELVIQMRYTSPQGRNRYRSEMTYRLGKIPEAFEKIERDEEYKRTAKYQRSRMSQSLRYKVLQRDGFRCVLCGRSADQGVELEIDHTIPVSKGGTTDEWNLRTLCRDCNRGKSAKYNPYGLN